MPRCPPDLRKLKAAIDMVNRTPIFGGLATRVLTPYAHAERLPLALALPKGVQNCELQGWAFSDGLEEIVLHQFPRQESKALGIVPVMDRSRTASHGNMRYRTVVVIAQYDNGWRKASDVTDQENLQAARDTAPTPEWIPANAIRVNIQAE